MNLCGVGFKKRRFVSKRIAFFGNVVCLPNFRESVSLCVCSGGSVRSVSKHVDIVLQS